MNTLYRFVVLIVAVMAISCSTQDNTDYTRFVDPFIGTDDHGHTFPGATTPFGMVQLSPDNGVSGWDWCSGYNWIDSTLVGFSHKHLSGTGIGDLADILFKPTVSNLEKGEFLPPKDFSQRFKSWYSHEDEAACPGYYALTFRDWETKENPIKAELTATPRVGIHRYKYPAGKPANLVIDLGFAINWDSPAETRIHVVNDTLIKGYRRSKGWSNNQHVYFVASFSKPIISHQLFEAGMEVEGVSLVNEKSTEAIISFGEISDLMVKVAISPTNTDGALKNLIAEAPHWKFNKYKRDASALWNEQLAKVGVQTSDPALKRTFYTALYHSFIAPNVFSDVDGLYRGIDREVHQTDGWDNYTVFSLWDTFRANHPLFTLFQPDLIPDLINAMLVHYQESGLLPVWTLEGCETNCMIGYHAIPVIVDAATKGFEFDYELAFEAVKASAMQDIRGCKEYREFGYCPADLVNESVSITLEYAYDDWCIAQLAKILDKQDEYDYFMKRAANYKNLFNHETGFMQGKLSDGSWKPGFNPLYSNHRDDEYTEGNAWQYTWFVPHDPEVLIGMLGGKADFASKLDSLFTHNEGVEGEFASSDISGLIGQYAHGNEPSHHTAYFYNFVGQPQKTQELIHRIRTELYSDKPDGLCGNEDCGQMSAWYVFSAMGFYPFNPADGKYQLGTPAFDKLVLKLEADKDFTVLAENLSPENYLVEEVYLNGDKLDRTWITHQEIMDGGELRFLMKGEEQ
ncbi:MAG: GH92 family glycosyl hydrolase [Bacteroidales bacterium]|nr:GH92 family glycosyl hydrolase [Bacteroidales bacterium]